MKSTDILNPVSKLISGKTRICGIIGDPIEHTISPTMQNAAFRQMGLDYVFIPFKVKKEDLREAIEGIKALNIRGLNVTIPHKVAVMPFLDEVDPLAENIGAVNTIVNNEGLLKGYNTDASGFLQSLLAENIQPAGKNVVILGAGGASRAIAFILADKGANLTILNRHSEAAKALAGWITRLFRREVIAGDLEKESLRVALKEADLLVNTTSVGMSPDTEDTLAPSRLIKSTLSVVDIIYNPLKTRLLIDAEKKGAKVIGGVEMLVQQGAAAFELWTGRKAPVDVMRSTAIEALNVRKD